MNERPTRDESRQYQELMIQTGSAIQRIRRLSPPDGAHFGGCVVQAILQELVSLYGGELANRALSIAANTVRDSGFQEDLAIAIERSGEAVDIVESALTEQKH